VVILISFYKNIPTWLSSLVSSLYFLVLCPLSRALADTAAKDELAVPFDVGFYAQAFLLER
jgi:hypothetical protein